MTALLLRGYHVVIVALIGMSRGGPPPAGLVLDVLTCDACGFISRPLWYVVEAKVFRCGTCPLPPRLS